MRMDIFCNDRGILATWDVPASWPIRYGDLLAVNVDGHLVNYRVVGHAPSDGADVMAIVQRED